MSNPITTDYKALYGSNAEYFGHQGDRKSFNKLIIADLKNYLNLNNLNLLDIGGGNGYLAKKIKDKHISALTVDVGCETLDEFVFFNLAEANEYKLNQTLKLVQEKLDSRWFTTCFDVIEHIDIEDLAIFMQNFSFFVSEKAVISISTRPSSRFNKFHSTLLPVGTWMRIFNLYGFKATHCKGFNNTRTSLVSLPKHDHLGPLRDWLSENPFQESDPFLGTHYIQLEKIRNPLKNSAFELNSLLDINYRKVKRKLIPVPSGNIKVYPKTVFLVSSIQDWIYARNLIDFYSRDDFSVLLFKSKNLDVNSYKTIQSFLERVNITLYSTIKFDEIQSILTKLLSLGFERIVSAFDGNTCHAQASNILFLAREFGFLALTLQHGMTIKNDTCPTADYFLCWGDNIKKGLDNDKSFSKLNSHVIASGSPKLLECHIKIDKRSIYARLGISPNKYKSIVLIATNLHWDHVNSNLHFDVKDWLPDFISHNRETMFIIKPHPKDCLLSKSKCLEMDNTIYISQNTLNMIDWPMTRLIKSCDAVISTFSSILAEAEASCIPYYMFPPKDLSSLAHNHIDLEKTNPPALLLKNITILPAESTLKFRLPKPKSGYQRVSTHKIWHKESRDFAKNFLYALSQRQIPLTQKGLKNLLQKNYMFWNYQ